MTVLLAVSGGTAEAQSVSFSTETATVKEGVAANADGAVRVKVTSTGNPGTVTLVANPPFTGTGAVSGGMASNGIITVAGVGGTNPTPTITLTRNQAELIITQPAESPTGVNWNSERTVLALRANAGTRIGPDLVLTTDDLEGQPEVLWSKKSIKLTEESRASGVIRALSTSPPGKMIALFTPFTEKTATGRHRIRIKVEPANGIGTSATATWRITDADGANIDANANWFTVTVEGSTAVPALPLVAQLLLALFLTTGGARLYRRRQR